MADSWFARIVLTWLPDVYIMKTDSDDELHSFYKSVVVLFNGTMYSYVKNLQGDIVAILNSAGTAVVNYVYDAWGCPISKTGSMAGTLGTVQPFRYRGYVYDEETGLYYLQSRYYAPENVRFLNADIYVSTGHGLLDSNVFAYCWNNPVIRSDEAGTDPLTQDTADDTNPLDDYENFGGLPSGGGGSGGSIGTYHAPNGGGGITSIYQLDSPQITFGHGGRHLLATENLSRAEYAIVQDVISRGITERPVGWYNRMQIPFDGRTLEYRVYVLNNYHIHVGTYFYPDVK